MIPSLRLAESPRASGLTWPLVGTLLAVSLSGCFSAPDDGATLARSRATAAAAEAHAARCAIELDAVAASHPEVAWSALDPESTLHRPGPLAGEAAGRVARASKEEISRRLHSVQGLTMAVGRLGQDPTRSPGASDSLDLAERARVQSSRLCAQRDLAEALVASLPEQAPAPGLAPDTAAARVAQGPLR
jgi:hypothetical protein